MSEASTSDCSRIERSAAAWTALASLLLLGAIAAPFFCDRIYTRDDLGAFHLPLRQFYATCLEQGSNFDWWPGVFCGYPAAAEGQAGMYHPAHWLLYRFVRLEAAFSLELLASYPLMFAGMFVFLRRHALSRAGALFGAMTFAFSTFNLLHFVHPNAIAIVAHMPWLLWCINIATTSLDRRCAWVAWAGVAFLTGSQCLLGYPQYVAFSLLAETAYATWLCGLNVRQCLTVASAKALGLAIGAVQWWSTLGALAESSRSGVDASFALAGSLHPANLVQLVAPYALQNRVFGENTHEYGVYAGAPTLLLIVWLIACRRSSVGNKPLLRWSLGGGALALTLALGAYGPLIPLLSQMPGGGVFRFPSRHIVLFQFALAIVAAIAFASLCRCLQTTSTERTRSWPLFAVAALSWWLVPVLVILDCTLAPWPLVLLGPTIFTLAAVIISLAARGSRVALVAVVLLTALDLGFYGASYGIFPDVDTPSQIVDRIVPPPGAGRAVYDLGLDADGRNVGNGLTLVGGRRADGYAGLAPIKQLRFDHVNALRAASVHWVALTEQNVELDGLEPHDSKWLRVPSPCMRAYCVTRAVQSDEPAHDIRRIDPATTALTSCAIDLSAGEPGVVQLATDAPGAIALRCDVPSRQLLVLTESFHTDWTAVVDDRDVPVVRANGDFLACVVEPGVHDVQFRYRSRRARTGGAVSLSATAATLVIAAALAVLPHRRTSNSLHSPRVTNRDHLSQP